MICVVSHDFFCFMLKEFDGEMVSRLSCITIKKNNLTLNIENRPIHFREKCTWKIQQLHYFGVFSLKQPNNKNKIQFHSSCCLYTSTKVFFHLWSSPITSRIFKIPHFLHRCQKLRRTKHSINNQQILQVATFISTEPKYAHVILTVA